MADLGYLVEGALLVHGVHLTDDGLERDSASEGGARDLPAKQSVGRGRTTTTFAFLRVRRARGHRH
jgi:hypothetical protein